MAPRREEEPVKVGSWEENRLLVIYNQEHNAAAIENLTTAIRRIKEEFIVLETTRKLEAAQAAKIARLWSMLVGGAWALVLFGWELFKYAHGK